MTRLLRAAIVAMALAACGVRGPPRPPVDEPTVLTPAVDAGAPQAPETCPGCPDVEQ
jgi:predicted small lipoprotein YifL